MTATEPAGTPDLPARSRLSLPALDGFRALAAVTVVLYHCFLGAGSPRLDEGSLRAVLAAGYMGVDFFFAISGFLLFLPAVLNGGDLGKPATVFSATCRPYRARLLPLPPYRSHPDADPRGFEGPAALRFESRATPEV